MASDRKQWNKNQKVFKELLLSTNQHDEAISRFMIQHTALYSSQMAATGDWSFEDEVLHDMTEQQLRRVPLNCEHSVAWTIWHMARIEDTAINMLVADRPQLLTEEGWYDRLKVVPKDTGNMMSKKDIIELSTAIDIEALRAYRIAVGRRTRKIVSRLNPDDLFLKVDPARLQKVLDEGAVVREAQGLIDYWSKRTTAGLLLMPATRHNFVHLNEALKLKKRRQ